MTREELNARYPWMKDTELFQHANGGGWVERPEAKSIGAIQTKCQCYSQSLQHASHERQLIHGGAI
jgi:hypothetical protein